MNHKFHPSILRAYDIRGVFNQTLFVEDAFFVGKSFASFLSKSNLKKIVVACDGRVSSPQLKASLIKGLLESGLEVIDIGVGPTPLLYFAVYHLSCVAGIMITGSHNPKDHNGFKMTLADKPFYGNDILNLAKIAQEGDFISSNDGFVKKVDVNEEYIERILSDCILAESNSALLDEIDQFQPKKKLKIAWDAGNGATATLLKRITDRISAEHFLLFDELDGDFPNHHPDPTVIENLLDLKHAIIENNCDFGIAFDGDGDRIGVMDGEGEVLWGDQLMILFAKDVLADKSKDNNVIIADVKASSVLFDEIRKNGGTPIMWKTGHSLIKAKMKETKALLAGEMSGHIFFADKYFGFDDALYASIRLINIIYKSSISLAQIRKEIPQTFSNPEIRIECSDNLKFKIIAELQQKLKKQNIAFNDIDGIRVDNNDGWWLLRASNTQPVIVARCESNSIIGLDALKSGLVAIIAEFNLKINF